MLMIIKFQMKHTRTLILVIHTLFIYLFSFISLKNTLTHLHSNNNWSRGIRVGFRGIILIRLRNGGNLFYLIGF